MNNINGGKVLGNGVAKKVHNAPLILVYLRLTCKSFILPQGHAKVFPINSKMGMQLNSIYVPIACPSPKSS